MKTEYGVPVPRGVPKDWIAAPVSAVGATLFLRRKSVPLDWGEVTACVKWTDRFGRLRACVGHYANGRSALVRIDANGVWKTTFGEAA